MTCNNEEHQRKTLIVFPGEIFPLNMGSRRRVFNLIQHLIQNNVCIDLLIISAEPIDKTFQQDYNQFTNQTFFIESKSKRTCWKKRFVKKIAKYLKVIGFSPNQQESFSERVFRKENDETKKVFQELIDRNNYSHVIISYAWMMWVVDDCTRPDLNIICDTYDVQYQRNKTIFSSSRLNVFDFQHEKFLELSYLKKADYILAISQNDYNELVQYIEPKKMILCSIDFEYIMNLHFTQPRKEKNALIFGFIGTNMISNTLSLKVVLEEWWPEISRVLPHAKLYIAGSISNALEDIDSNIIILGKVKDLHTFYEKIDCLLFPNYVFGGINLKVYESIFLNKVILSNKQYLDNVLKELIVVWDNQEVEQILSRVSDLLEQPDYREKTKKLYLTQYHPDIIYRDLKNVLR